jgi:hypothetical protein
VCWAKRWSALEGEELDEWQLYVEGRERSYGTCARRRDGLRLEGEELDEWQLYVEGRERSYGRFAGRRDGLRSKGNSWTSGNCTLRGGKDAMVRLLGDGMIWSA